MISYLVAVDNNRLIGKNNTLPWHLPADLTYFKKTTMGHPIVMGRKTYESIGRPLPGRTNVILTRDASFKAPGCQVFYSPEDVLNAYDQHEELFIIGGASIFKAFEPYVDRLYITVIDHIFEGDTYFTFDYSDWKQLSVRVGQVDENNHYPHRFLILERS